MTTTKWESTVSAIGPEASAFLEAGILVLFGPDAPEELTEFAVLHPAATLVEPVAPGDVVTVGAEQFRVTAVGEVANTNLANLGHAVFKWNGQTEPELPGDICLEVGTLPPIDVGLSLRISGPSGDGSATVR